MDYFSSLPDSPSWLPDELLNIICQYLALENIRICSRGMGIDFLALCNFLHKHGGYIQGKSAGSFFINTNPHKVIDIYISSGDDLALQEFNQLFTKKLRETRGIMDSIAVSRVYKYSYYLQEKKVITIKYIPKDILAKISQYKIIQWEQIFFDGRNWHFPCNNIYQFMKDKRITIGGKIISLYKDLYTSYTKNQGEHQPESKIERTQEKINSLRISLNCIMISVDKSYTPGEGKIIEHLMTKYCRNVCINSFNYEKHNHLRNILQYLVQGYHINNLKDIGYLLYSTQT